VTPPMRVGLGLPIPPHLRACALLAIKERHPGGAAPAPASPAAAATGEGNAAIPTARGVKRRRRYTDKRDVGVELHRLLPDLNIYAAAQDAAVMGDDFEAAEVARQQCATTLEDCMLFQNFRMFFFKI
jgi:hypothetical protein